MVLVGSGMEDGGSLAGKLDSIVSSSPVSREPYGSLMFDDGNERGVDMPRLLQDRCQRTGGDGGGGTTKGRQSLPSLSIAAACNAGDRGDQLGGLDRLGEVDDEAGTEGARPILAAREGGERDRRHAAAALRPERT